MSITSGIRSGICAGLLAGINASCAAAAVEELRPGVLTVGDSNDLGIAEASAAETSFPIATPFPGVTLTTWYAANQGNPLISIPAEELQPQDFGAGDRFGPEITMGRDLYQSMPSVGICKIAVPGTDLSYWTGAGQYKAELVANALAWQTATGKLIGTAKISAGANDGNGSEALALAFEGRLTTLIADLRAALGASLKIVIPQVPLATTIPHIAIIRAAIVAVVAADPLAEMVYTDDLPLIDGSHYTADSYIALGQRCAAKALGLLDVTRHRPSRAAFVGADVARYGVGANSPRAWAGAIDGDIQVLGAVGGYVAGSPVLSVAAGFVELEIQASASAGFFSNAKAWVRPVTQAILDANGGLMPTPTLSAAHAFNASKIITIRNASGLAAIVDSGGGVNNAFTGTVTATGITTLVDNTEVFVLLLGMTGSSVFSLAPALTNPALADIADRPAAAMVTGGNSLFIGLSTARKAIAGNAGVDTMTMTTATLYSAITFAVAP